VVELLIVPFLYLFLGGNRAQVVTCSNDRSFQLAGRAAKATNTPPPSESVKVLEGINAELDGIMEVLSEAQR